MAAQCARVRIVYTIGVRPNIMKMAPVMAALRRRLPSSRHVLVHTGQHYDTLMSDALLQDLSMPTPDYALNVGSGSHAQQTARVMARLEPVLRRERPDMVLVGGDANSTLATALAAAQLGIPVAHIESGLRSFDRAMPEELNRVLTDHIAENLFVHCADAVQNLQREGIGGERIYLAGNTMIDSLIAIEPRIRAAALAARLGLRAGDYLLVTLHRPALVDGPLLPETVVQLRALTRHLPVVFPVHPRTRIGLEGLELGPRARVLDPLSYIEFASLQSDARAVLTDSGGVQEETTFLGIPCFTLRDNTERPITITHGTNTLLGLDPARIADILPALAAARPSVVEPPPGWDGRAGERIAEAIVAIQRAAGEIGMIPAPRR